VISAADTACGSLTPGTVGYQPRWHHSEQPSPEHRALPRGWQEKSQAQKGKAGLYTGLLQGCKVCCHAAKGQEPKTNAD